jgi:hypothetical protein
MFVTITNAGKGKPYRLSESIDNLKIGVKSVSGRVGWYNIKEENWRYTHQGGAPSDPITIEPGLYNFESFVKTLTDEIDGFEINVNEKTGKILMTIPAEYQIWMSDSVRKILGIDDEDWLDTGEYEGDRPVEFSPQRIEIYLRQLNTSKNLQNQENTIIGSQLLGLIPLSNVGFGEYFSTIFENPYMKELQNGAIHELDLDFKVVWQDRTEKLDNHDQPLNLELIIK